MGRRGASTTPRHHVRRKPGGGCSLCATPIEVGQRYAAWRWFGDDGPGVVNVHPDCWDLANEHNVHEWVEGDTFWEILYEMTRPDVIEAVEACGDSAVGSVWLAHLRECWDDER